MENIQNCAMFDQCNHKDCTNDFCLRKYKLDDLYANSCLSDYQRKHQILRVDSDPRYSDRLVFEELKKVESDIYNFVQSGKNLYLYSATSGNGKTAWAVRLMQAYFNSIWPTSSLGCHALFVHVPKFLAAVKDNFTNHNEYAQFIMDHIMTADLVVWDEIADKPGSEYDMNKLLGYIDGRLACGRSNIYTANRDFYGIQQTLGTRLASRICQLSNCMKFVGTDKRSTDVRATWR